MSEFSEKCKMLLEENGISVYRFSKESGLERTALQRMLNGKRVPNEQFVMRFVKALRIPRREEKQLLELYEYESTGETKYYTRRYIKQIINNLILESHNEDIPENKNFNGNTYNLLSSKLEAILSEVLEEAFTSGKEEVLQTNFPTTNVSFIREVLRLEKKYSTRKIKIQHMFSLKIKPEEVLYNLEVLNYMLPLVNSKYIEYNGYFQYMRMEDEGYPLLAFPFYIVTSNRVLLFNNVLTEFVIFSSQEVLAQYHKELEAIRRSSRTLIECISSSSQALMKYENQGGLFNKVKIIMESQPCLCGMMSEDMFLSIIKKYAPQLMPLGKQIIEQGAFNRTEDIIFFSKAGMEKFCETGTFEGQIGAFLPALNLEERRRALQYLLDKCSSGDLRIYVMSEKLCYPENVYLEMTEGHGISIINMTDLNNIRFSTISDTNIGGAFEDFFDALIDSGEAYNSEETEKYVQVMLEKML